MNNSFNQLEENWYRSLGLLDVGIFNNMLFCLNRLFLLTIHRNECQKGKKDNTRLYFAEPEHYLHSTGEQSIFTGLADVHPVSSLPLEKLLTAHSLHSPCFPLAAPLQSHSNCISRLSLNPNLNPNPKNNHNLRIIFPHRQPAITQEKGSYNPGLSTAHTSLWVPLSSPTAAAGIQALSFFQP